ncbi:hypothetical protein Sango_0668100 [Sesamum angolense]|uniref:Uncharacterized protein n=1 Tax=Sesamum angolense TaxID=2727404 RepID=A0AAE1X7H1_9LAMI|nr:hypothetical protein Sango_0668100 [Sesamum angolense]
MQGSESKDPIPTKRLKFRANRFTMINGELYRRTTEGPLLKCLGAEKAKYVANGQTEVSNRILLQHLETRLNGANGSWVKELPGVLWAYRITPRTTTGETLFCLVYGSKVVIPAEIGEETTRVAQYDPVGNEQARKFDLVTIEEIRNRAYAKILHYKGLMMKSYNSR